jgi:ABC-type nitrate/sulfonate/bicarbonate transport system substrate-binding protein
MKETLRLLLAAIAIVGGLNRAQAQPLPIKVGYTALAGSFTPLWIAKELDLFERQGIQCSPIYMASTLAYQAMLAGETNFAVGASIPPVQARLGLSPARRFSNQATCAASALELRDLERPQTSVQGLP